ncbi:MAG TPA: hypothetical protein PKL44_00240 [Candidatus Dojkabacteria bacterium]|nr:hypothetical protein [Candidatus Dojkabacteria bacterium]
MITRFVAGRYYKCSLSERSQEWNEDGEMDFMLDGNWHKCKKAGGPSASFYDSPDPEYMWAWGDLDYFEERDYLNLEDELNVLLKYHTPEELIKSILILAKRK